MKKQIAIIILAILLLASVIQDISAATTVFLTSDNIMGTNDDADMLNSIKTYIEEISNGKINVIVDSQSPGPGEGTRAIEADSNVSVVFAAVDPGNFLVLSKYSTATTDKQIIFVNTGDYDLDTAESLRRAWDDNYSNESLAGLRDPGTLLINSGIQYIQLAKDYPQNVGDNGILEKYDEDMNRDIAQRIVNMINNYNNETPKELSEKLIVTNKISPKGMADASKMLVESGDKEMKGPYGSYTTPQLLYQTSSYLNGNGIDIPKSYEEPEDPLGVSVLTKDTYSVYDYFKMGGIVKNYMDENGRAPDSIEYEGARISYYDLTYNFAKIVQNHTDTQHMGFESEYHFDKVNDSILLHLLPFVLIFVVLILAYLFMKRIRII